MQDTSKAWSKGFHDEMTNGPSSRGFRFTPWGTDGAMASAYRDGRRFAAKKRKQSANGCLYMFE